LEVLSRYERKTRPAEKHLRIQRKNAGYEEIHRVYKEINADTEKNRRIRNKIFGYKKKSPDMEKYTRI
jgi:hypothetical protein